MTFNIIPQPELLDKFGMRASITIGDWTETLYLQIGYWKLTDYQAHWKREVSRLLSGETEKSILFVGMKNPKLTKKFIEGWPMWRAGEKVYFHNTHFSMEKHRYRFKLNDPGLILETFNPDRSKRFGQEWVCSVADLQQWLDAQDKLIP